jgi:hypothetical protein
MREKAGVMVRSVKAVNMSRLVVLYRVTCLGLCTCIGSTVYFLQRYVCGISIS